MTAPSPPARSTSLLPGAIMVIALACAGYVILHAFQNYQGGNELCAINAAQRGVENVADACRFPIRAILIGVLILVVGWRIGGWLKRR